MGRGHMVVIKNRETGAIERGNWKGLRKKLGVSGNLKASKCVKYFDRLGWDVVSGYNPSGKASNGVAVNGSNGNSAAEALVRKLAANGADASVNCRSAVVAIPEKTDADKGSAPVEDQSPTPEDVFGENGFQIPAISKDYIRRGYDDKLANILDNLGSREYPFLYGDAGTGKTEMVKNYCASRRIPYIRIALDETMSFQYLVGRLTIDNGTVVFREGLLVKALQWDCVLFLDEANACTPNKSFLLHPLLDSGCVYIPEADKYYFKHPDCRIVLAGNYQNGKYTGVQKMNGALQSRLTMIKVDPIEVKNVKFDFIQSDERKKLVKFYNGARDVLQKGKSKAVLSLRHLIRYDRLRSVGFTEEEAIESSFLNAIEYVDDKIVDDVRFQAKNHFGF